MILELKVCMKHGVTALKAEMQIAGLLNSMVRALGEHSAGILLEPHRRQQAWFASQGMKPRGASLQVFFMEDMQKI